MKRRVEEQPSSDICFLVLKFGVVVAEAVKRRFWVALAFGSLKLA